jgi:hypothetical protein
MEGYMSEKLKQLENVLCEELRVFSNILRLEREKSEAIIKRDGGLLEKLSKEQEDCLNMAVPLEKDRKKLTEQYSKNKSETTLTLTDIADIEGMPDCLLVQTGDLLKRTLEKIKSIQETNSKMINDNMEFFSKMVKKLKDCISFETGYGKKGMERTKTINSFILDRMI